MGSVLSKGYKKPSTGDRDWYSQLEDNIQRQNDHSHDGVDSFKLSPSDFDKSTGNILAAGWVAVSGQAGTYKQTVTVPSGYAVNAMQVKFYVSGGSEDGHEIHPSIQKVTDQTYDVFINDNSVSLVAVYG